MQTGEPRAAAARKSVPTYCYNCVAGPDPMVVTVETYNPHRVLYPMKRTNPKKGRDEDPGFVRISWDEAFEAIVSRLKDIRERGLIDEAGLPRVAATFGNGGTPRSYMGTFPAFLAAWGPIDFSFGSG